MSNKENVISNNRELRDLFKGEKIYNVDESFYYVYEHYLDGEVIYVGKGKGSRAYSSERNYYWETRVGDKMDEVEVKIVGYFEIEDDALFFERLLIRRRVSEGYNICNIKHNSSLKDYLNNEVEFTERKQSESEDSTAETGKITMSDFSKVKESSLKFKHIEQVRTHIKSLYIKSKKNDNKGFAVCKTVQGQFRLANIIEELGLKPLVLWSPLNTNNPMSEKQLRWWKYISETGKIPDEFDFLISNTSEKEWVIRDSRVNFVIVDTVSKVDGINILDSLSSINPDIFVCKTIDKITHHYVEFPDELLNKLLSPKDKEKLIKKLQIRNDRGNLIKWPKLKEILESQEHTIEETRRRINGKITRVSIVRHPDDLFV